MPKELKLLRENEWESYGISEEEFRAMNRHVRYYLRYPERRKLAGKKWRDKNLQYNRDRQRQYQLRYNYGITEECYAKLLAEQQGRCAICNTDTPTGKWKVFAVDHCHHTGKVRGLLCNECNRGMGLLRDSAELLEKAAAYLRKHKIITKEERDESKV